MSSISDIAERSAAAVGTGLNPSRLQGLAGRWLMFSDFGATAQRHMAVVWSCVGACALAAAIWLPNSRLSFASSNWPDLLHGLINVTVACAFIIGASVRLRDDQRRPAVVLRAMLHVTELLWRTALPLGALLTAGVTLSYLITAADLPLQDAVLARLDHALGFDWLGFLGATNASPVVAALLTQIYATIGPVAEAVIVWLALSRRGERLTELMAIVGVTTIGLCIGMALVPAAGAFAYFKPAPDVYANYSALGEMWGFGQAYGMLRDGTLSVIDLAALQGVVSFPSFHTMLGIMTIYALRDTRWLMIPVLVVNGAMIVTTLPVGGHHLSDVIAGAGLTFAAILFVRRLGRPATRV